MGRRKSGTYDLERIFEAAELFGTDMAIYSTHWVRDGVWRYNLAVYQPERFNWYEKQDSEVDFGGELSY